jgi:SAM-dependent methyltransferase
MSRFPAAPSVARSALRIGAAPLRLGAQALIRLVPCTQRGLAGRTWLWQPGWERACHERGRRPPDPYGLPAGEYEELKRALVVEVLGQVGAGRGRVLEVGCGDGLLTARLAGHAAELVAVDVSEVAVARARMALAHRGHVVVERRAVPLDMPEGAFDLIVCCDVLYYWAPHTLRLGLDRLVERLRPGGRLVMLHDRGHFGQAGTADAVHDTARTRAVAGPDLLHELSQTLRHTGPGGAGLRVDVVRRVPSARLLTDGPDLPRQLRGTAAVARLWTAGAGSSGQR